MAFVGSRFSEPQLRKPGCPLYVTVNLPGTVIAAVVSAISCERQRTARQEKWSVGAAITQMSDVDAARLAAYLVKRANSVPVFAIG